MAPRLLAAFRLILEYWLIDLYFSCPFKIMTKYWKFGCMSLKKKVRVVAPIR